MNIAGYAGESLMFPEERSWLLSQIPAGGRVLEVGTWCATTASWVLDQRPDIARWVALDTFTGGQGNGVPGKDAWESCIENCLRHQRRLCLFVGGLTELEWSGRFSLGIVDGNHSYESVLDDLTRASSMCDAIVAHDYHAAHVSLAGVRKAVDEFCAQQRWRVVASCNLSVQLEQCQEAV